MNINWYPGHMTKTRRMMAETIKMVDVVCELFDARIPVSSRNPDILELTAEKPRVVILNRADQADPTETKKWADAFKKSGCGVIETDAKSGRGIDSFAPAVMSAAAEKLARLAENERFGAIRAMIVGVPNVGKSSLINRIHGSKRAKTEDRPGVTRSKQWFYIDKGLELLDTPGILWPKFEDEITGLNLAFTGAIRDEILDIETIAAKLAEKLAEICPEKLEERFKLTLPEKTEEMFELAGGGSIYGAVLLEELAKKRGCVISGGETDYHRISVILLDEFRGGKIGRITLEPFDGREV